MNQHAPASVAGPTDEELLGAHGAGDPTAFAAIFERYRRRTFAYALRMVGRPEVAEEVCTEAFLRVLEGRWKPTGRFQAFLFTVVHRASLERIRKRTTARRLEHKVPRQVPDPDPLEHLQVADRKAQVVAALGQLSEEHRAVLLLYYAQDLRSREVGEVLGCTDQQARSRLSYARRKLRELLDEEVP